MKAILKKTGQVVEIDNHYSSIYIDGDDLHHSVEEFDFLSAGMPADYWAKIRCQYAGMALQAILTNPYWNEANWETVAFDAVQAADALIKELNK